jgi:hypothetical protein
MSICPAAGALATSLLQGARCSRRLASQCRCQGVTRWIVPLRANRATKRRFDLSRTMCRLKCPKHGSGQVRSWCPMLFLISFVNVLRLKQIGFEIGFKIGPVRVHWLDTCSENNSDTKSEPQFGHPKSDTNNRTPNRIPNRTPNQTPNRTPNRKHKNRTQNRTQNRTHNQTHNQTQNRTPKSDTKIGLASEGGLRFCVIRLLLFVIRLRFCCLMCFSNPLDRFGS